MIQVIDLLVMGSYFVTFNQSKGSFLILKLCPGRLALIVLTFEVKSRLAEMLSIMETTEVTS